MLAEIRRGYGEDGLISYLRNGDGEKVLTPTEFGDVRRAVDDLLSNKTQLKHEAPDLFAEMRDEVSLAAENIWLEELLELNLI